MTETLAASPLVRAIALALVEFVWQGAAIGLATALGLFLLRTTSAPLRYIVACAGLVAMTLAPLVTAAGYLREERNPRACPRHRRHGFTGDAGDSGQSHPERCRRA